MNGMCNFLSGLYFKNGDVFDAAEYTQSHEVMIRAHGIVDARSGFWDPACVRWEFVPPGNLETVADVSTWSLIVDEDYTPEWWDDAKVRAYCERRVRSMIIDGPRGTVLGGVWILTGKNATMKELVRGTISIVANGANLSGANLSGTNLDGTTLSGTTLSGANLLGANLSGANLSCANLDGTNLSCANLDGATLSRANLSRTNLSLADLSGANLYGANLSGANLSGATLDGANLYGANLSGANLSGTTLSRANLSGANLSGANGFNLPAEWKILDSGLVARS